MIKNIWYENQTIEVVNSVFLNSENRSDCSGSIRNLTLGKGLYEFATQHSDLMLLMKCPESILEKNGESVVNCGGLAVVERDDSPELEGLKGECGGVVLVPYSGGEREGKISRSTSLREVLSRGVLLRWVASNCSDCDDSGGQCGYNHTLSQFQCYCYDRPHSHQCHKRPKLRLILGLGITGVMIIFVAITLFWYRKKLNLGYKKSISMSASIDRTTSDFEKGTMYFGVPLFSYTELKEATNNFQESKELGDGGFGTVYHGKLKDGREVAVKRLYEKSYRGVEQFMNEVEILTRLRHHNLVSLYGCTSQHCRELLLVYEYVPNGTVADHLHSDKAKPASLPWHIRMNIAIETANALAYLHASDIIHRDVKTNNILLDNSFNVKVADFGLSRLFPNGVTHVSTAPQGTPGYVDPEYHQCYQLTDKSDVYSFGVVLIELISSLPAVDMERHRQEINLSNYAMSRIQRSAFDELVDPRLGFMSDFRVRRMTTLVAELAFQCLQHDKEFRPSMDEVLETLKRIESANYEELKAEEEAKNGEPRMECSMPPPSPSENDDANLLNSHHQLHPPSPNSVMDKWGSRLTTPGTSK